MPTVAYFAGDEFVRLWSIFIVSYFVGVLIWYVRSWWPIRSALKRADARLRECGCLAGTTDISDRELAKNYSEYEKYIYTEAKLGDVWEEFHHCIDTKNLDQVDAEGPLPVRNFREPDEYLNEATLIQPNIRTAFFQTVPSQFAALGILGTFIGLAAGINVAAPDLADGTTDSAITAIQSLLGGASVAFVTSVVGITSSLIFLWVERGSMSSINRHLGKWVHDLGQAMQFKSAEELAAEQLRAQENTALSMSTFVDNLANRLVDTFEEALDKNFSDKLGPELRKLIDAVEAAGNQQSEKSQEGLDKMADSFLGQLKDNVGDQFAAIKDTLGNLDGTLGASTRSMEQLQHELRDSMREMVEQLRESLADSSARIQGDVEKRMTAVTAGIEEAVQSLSKNADESSRRVADTLSTSGAAAGAALQGSAVEAGEVMRTSASQSADTMAQSAEDAGNALRAGTGAASTALTDAVNQAMGQLSASMELLTQRVESAGAGLVRTMAESSQQVAADQRGAMEGFVGGVQSLQDSALSNKDLVVAVNQLLERLEGVGASLTTVHEQIQRSATPLTTASTTLQTAADELQQQLGATAETARIVADSATTIQDSLVLTTKVWESYQGRFEGIDRDVGQAFEAMQAEIAKFMQSNHDYLNTLDKSAGDAITKLGAANQDLKDAVDDLVDAMDQRNG